MVNRPDDGSAFRSKGKRVAIKKSASGDKPRATSWLNGSINKRAAAGPDAAMPTQRALPKNRAMPKNNGTGERSKAAQYELPNNDHGLSTKKYTAFKKGDKYDSNGRSLNENLDKTYGKSGTSFGGDVNRAVYQGQNDRQNWANGIAGGVGDMLGYLTGNKDFSQTGDSWRKGSGSFYSRDSESPKVPAIHERVDPGRFDQGTPLADTATDPAPEKVKGFLDFLKQAQGMTAGQGGDGVDYSGLRNDLSSRAATGDASIEAMYRQLQGKYAAEAPAVKQNFTDAGAAMTQHAGVATAGVDAAANAATSQQAEQFKALGIQQGTDGEGIRRDAALAKQHIAEYGQASQDNNTGHGANAAQYNTSMGDVAGLKGAEQRGALQAQLQSKMADIGLREQASQASAASNNLSMSMSLAEKLQGDYKDEQQRADELANPPGMDPKMMNALRGNDEFTYQMQQDADARLRRAGVPEQIVAAMKSTGLDPKSPEYAKTFSLYSTMYSDAAR